MRSLILGFARNIVFANIILVLILAAGIMAVTSMQRELFPDIAMDEIIVEVVYPGASPLEVKEGVVLKIEEVLEGMEGIAQYTTRSEDNLGQAEILVRHGYDPSLILDRIRAGVNAVSTFPKGIENPVIFLEMHRTEVMKLYLAGPLPEEAIKELGRGIKQRLRLLDQVSQIEIFGTRDYEIHVEVSESDLRAQGLSLESISQRIAQNNLTLAGGIIQTREKNIRILTRESKYTGRELGTIAVKADPDGSILFLDRLARIKDGFSDQTLAVTINNSPGLVLEIYKTGKEDALAISKAVRAFIRSEKDHLPENLNLGILYDLTDDLRSRLDLMIKNGIMGLALVLTLLWIFLDFRLGFWVGMGIPISIFGALALVWIMGGSINMLSLFGLITVLGIVVDDAIVVGEAVFYQFQKGRSPLEAAVEGVTEVGMPVGVSVLTTIMAFLPLAYIGDVIGKFLSILPMVVIPCLVISLVESFFILPAHLARALEKKQTRPGLFKGLKTRIHKGMDKSADLYQSFLSLALAKRYLFASGAICMLCLSLGLIRGGMVKFEVLPETNSPLITSRIKMEAGTSAIRTKEAVDLTEQALIETFKSLDNKAAIRTRMSVVGSSLGEDPESGDNMGGVMAVLEKGQEISSQEILKLWEKKTGQIPGINSLGFEVRSEGPPGEPIEVWLRGNDARRLKSAALDLTRELKKIEGVGQIQSNAIEEIDEFRLILKPEARFLGLTPQDLANQVRGSFYGWEALRLQRGKDDIKVRVRFPRAAREDISSLGSLGILTPEGYRVPLTSVANIHLSRQPHLIYRVDGLNCLTIQADVDETRVNADQIIESLSQGFLKELQEKYPDLDISFEGEEKHMKDALGGLYYGFPLAILGIFVLVAAMFRSYVQPFIILFSIPFGMIGSILGHLVFDIPLSLMSIFGMVALCGIVVNDAVVLMNRVNLNLNQGEDVFPAIIQAGQRRFRAIILTSISTLGGLAPLLVENSDQARFLIPMAVSISGGLIFATLLTLVLIPCLFVILNDLRRLIHKIRTGEPVSREAVEPGWGIGYPDPGPGQVFLNHPVIEEGGKSI